MSYKTLPVKIGAVAPWVNTYIAPSLSQGLVIMGGHTGASVSGGTQVAGGGAMGSTHFMPGAYPGPEFQVYAGGDDFTLTHGSGFAGDIGNIEDDYQLSLAVTAAAFFPTFFKRPKPTFGMDGNFTETCGGVAVQLNGRRLFTQPACQDALLKVCDAWTQSAIYKPQDAQGEFPAMFIPVPSASMGGSTPLTVQALFTYNGSFWEVYDYSRRAAAMAAATTAKKEYAATLSTALNDVSFGKVPWQTTALTARPYDTTSYELHPDDRATLDAWWDDCVKQTAKLAGVTSPASADPKLAAAYAARPAVDQELNFDDWFVKTQRGGSTAPVAAPTEGKSWWESALAGLGSAATSAIGWAGTSIVDLAKSWGPLGTTAAVGAATGMFGAATPWLIAIGLGLLIMR